ncbi:MAG: glycosyltransferase family 9 protein [Candidatus Kapaibacterium sp.]
MLNRGLSQIGLRILDRATDSFPHAAPRLFERALVGIFGSRPVASYVLRKYRKQWDRIAADLEQPCKILLVVDVSIGDTVLASECLPAIQAAFPKAEVHFVCNRTGGELITGMPGIHVHNFIQGVRGFPTEEDLSRLRELISKESFTAILNLGPFLDARKLPEPKRVMQIFVPFAAYMLRAWKAKGSRHISYYARAYVSDFLGRHGEIFEGKKFTEPALPLNTNTVYLSRESIDMASAFLASHGLMPGCGLVFLNPDATSQFGQIPFDVQSQVLRHLAEMEEVNAVLLGKTYSFKGTESRLMAQLPERLQKKIVIVPHVPIEVYTALIDASDMFISGDTGPLHVSACRKQGPSGYAMRNKTVILAIYGATDSRMYGYDSEQPHHVPANQDAPSRSFSAPAPCRNISCINKFGKSCGEVRCFNGLPIEEIKDYITAYFKQLPIPDAAVSGDIAPGTHPPITITLKPKREYAF